MLRRFLAVQRAPRQNLCSCPAHAGARGSPAALPQPSTAYYGSNIFESNIEHVVQHEGNSLRWSKPFEDNQERQTDRFG
jgi:hypothetical protein